MTVTLGFSEPERDTVARLYWAAFGQKLGRVMGPEGKAVPFIRDVLDPTHALCARGADGTLLGVAGFKTYDSALVGGSFLDLTRHYGWAGSLWRMLLLQLLERDTDNDRFLMDGIFVREAARGRGVGSTLLDAICAEAARRGYAEVRLDVIDTNPRARKLYEREGFVAQDTHHLGPLRHVFGFRSAVTMVRRVAD